MGTVSQTDSLRLAQKAYDQGNATLAYKLYLQATREDPRQTIAWINLGDALRVSKKFRLAIRCYEKALALEDTPLTRLVLGECLAEIDEFQQAWTHLSFCVTQAPQIARAWYGLAMVAMQLENLDGALSANAEALRLEPQLADVRFQRSILYLLGEDYVQGFRHYEARLTMQGEFLPMTEPAWHGEELGAKILHVYSEQGLGDVIQFARYVNELARSAQVVWTVPRELRRLFEPTFGHPRITLHTHGDVPPPADLSVSLGSLPHYLKNFAVSGEPYLKCPGVDKVLERVPGAKALGICWAGSATHQHDRRRSSSPEVFAEELMRPGSELFSLQYQPKDVDPALLGEMGLIQDLSPRISDLADSAAFIRQLDAVVSVDTSIAHLCGALGVRCHVIIPYGALDWRWGVRRTDSRWYDSVTLYRQQAGESVRDVLKRISGQL